MESQLSFLATRAVSPAPSPSSEGAPAAAQARTGVDRRDFAEVLTGESLRAQRQHLAALGKQGQSLQVLPLGNKLNVITSDEALPDLASLAQFARQQGLDEAAVQALFGPTLASVGITGTGFAAPVEAATLGGGVGTDADATLASASENAAGWATAGVEISLVAPPGGAVPLITPTPLATSAPSLVQPTVPTPGEPPMAAMAALTKAANAPVSMLPVLPVISQIAAPAMPTLAPSGIAAAANAQTTLMPMTAQAWVGVAAPAAVEAIAPATDLAPQDALRLTLSMPAPEITKRLAQMSGTGKESTWAALLASGPLSKDAMGGATETLTLDIPPDYDLGLDGLAPSNTENGNRELPAPTGSAAQQVVAQAAAGGSANSNAQAQADHRAQQFQQIADQMGHAAAQRLIAQIERGQWKMQMRMQPASLGNIQVELDMHAGGLDALFSADSAVTRELMAQGSNKLRDTLTSAGMTVASVTVNADQNRQSGGNPTPGKGRSAAPAVGSVNSPSQTAALAPRNMDMTQSDGLNVLA